MNKITIDEINKETPDFLNYYSDAIEYLTQFERTLPDKFDQVLPVQNVDDIFESDLIPRIVITTMSFEDCMKLVSYAKRFTSFNVLLRYFIEENKLPVNNNTVRFIATYIIELMLVSNNDLLTQALKIR